MGAIIYLLRPKPTGTKCVSLCCGNVSLFFSLSFSLSLSLFVSLFLLGVSSVLSLLLDLCFSFVLSLSLSLSFSFSLSLYLVGASEVWASAVFGNSFCNIAFLCFVRSVNPSLHLA